MTLLLKNNSNVTLKVIFDVYPVRKKAHKREIYEKKVDEVEWRR